MCCWFSQNPTPNPASLTASWLLRYAVQGWKTEGVVCNWRLKLPVTLGSSLVALTHLSCVELPHEDAKRVDIRVLAQPFTPEALRRQPADTLQPCATCKFAQRALLEQQQQQVQNESAEPGPQNHLGARHTRVSTYYCRPMGRKFNSAQSATLLRQIHLKYCAS